MKPESVLEQALQHTAAEAPDRAAIQFRDRRLSYRQLSETIDALGGKLGAVAGGRVLLLLPDGLPAYLCHLYCFLAGATLVPVSVKTTTSAIEQLRQRVQPHFCITSDALRARHLRALQDLPCVVIASDGRQTPWGFEYSVQGPQPSAEIPRRGQAADPARTRLIVFTSGSTGQPKGVCLSETNILAAARMMVSFLSLGPSRRSLVTVPLYDYYGFIQIYGHILAGSGYALGESAVFRDQLIARIAQGDVTDLVLVPYTLRQILKASPEKQRDALRAVATVTSSSDVLTPEILAQAFSLNPDLQIFNIYGLTEAGRACYRRISSSSAPSNSIGKASPGVQITVEGTEAEPGEIVIRGPNVMLGYLQGIQEDRIVYNPCTEIRTGDLGYYDAAGELILLGRRDHMFNVMGSKMHPSEIERVALQVPGVTDALARGRKEGDDSFTISLDVVLGDGAADVDRIREHLRKNLPQAFCPRDVNVVAEIRRTELGSKILRPGAGA